jgi:polyisoprenyl-phosphate glycosyltransferase
MPSEEVHISVVVPLYRCHDCIVELHRRLVRSVSLITASFEIVLVNDGSPQNDWLVVRELAARDPRVKAINLSRNFGQHYAIAAGLDYAEGDWVVVMDGDLQDPPEEIARLYAKASEGHDIVFARKPRKSHGFLKRLTSRSFNWILGYLMDTQLDKSVTHFSIVSRNVVRNLRLFKERNRSYAFFVRWVGFDVAYADVEHHPRYAGTGSYTLGKLFTLAFETMVSQSNKPLHATITFGFICALFAFLYGTYQILRYLLRGYPLEGWTSLIVSIYFLGGLGFVALGVLGLYVGKIFEETKHRPLYVVKDTVNLPQTAQHDTLGVR